tara:strand:- start:1787 stop:2317 length:531 start_codon:yes stop_codon:yes gene_type:complete
MGGQMRLISKALPSGTSACEFTGFSDIYQNYIFILNNLTPASAAAFYARAFLAGTEQTSAYLMSQTFSYTNSASDDAFTRHDSVIYFLMTEAVGSTAAQGGLSAFLTLTSPTNTEVAHRLYGNLNFCNASTYLYNALTSGHDNNASGGSAITKMKFWFNGQNFTNGSIAMYGVKDA